ncbi:type II secretion system F family protein [Lachnospiraceae bacterium 46-15]
MKRLLFPFYRISLWITGRIPDSLWKEKKREEAERQSVLYPGKKPEPEKYYAQRLAAVLAILFWGIGLAVFAEMTVGREDEGMSSRHLSRPSYGEGDRETELEAFIEGESENTVLPIQISERVYTAEEVQEVFKEITGKLEQQILGENFSLDKVRNDLVFPASLYEGAVEAEWMVSPADLLDTKGQILREPKETGELAEIHVLLKYREYQAEYTCYACIYPPARTEGEILGKRLKEEVARANEKGRYGSELILPEAVDGRKVIWKKPSMHIGGYLTVLVLIGAVLVWIQQKRSIQKLEQQRKMQLIHDYPEILFKIAMLLGAGLTLKGTFQKIAGEYREQKSAKLRYAYEEMLFACREMENGVGEAAAYERFGKRCGEPGYIKLGSILSQNLKKGAKGLQELLEQEAETGFEDRKHAARKLGEEAGTKLLFPMMLMLAVVLVILIVPAVLSF